jgi:hypothetical protein
MITSHIGTLLWPQALLVHCSTAHLRPDANNSQDMRSTVHLSGSCFQVWDCRDSAATSHMNGSCNPNGRLRTTQGARKAYPWRITHKSGLACLLHHTRGTHLQHSRNARNESHPFTDCESALPTIEMFPHSHATEENRYHLSTEIHSCPPCFRISNANSRFERGASIL